MSPMMGGMNGISGDSYSNSLRGLSGLSGFDRDGMVKTMTLRSRSRIAKYKQKLQLLSWKQEAMQSISDKMIELSRKYLSVGSENSLIREITFDNYSVEAFGTHKSKVRAVGSPSQLEGINILGISGKASDDTYVTSPINGSGIISTGELDLSKPVHFGAIEGTTLDIKIGLKENAREYQVKFVGGNYDIYERDAAGNIQTDGTNGPPKIDPEKAKKVKELFAESFRKTEVRIGNSTYTMADFIKVDFEPSSSGNTVEVRIKANDEVQVGGQTLGSLNALNVVGGTVFKKLGMNTVGEQGFDINSSPKGYMLTDTAKALIGGYTGKDDEWDNIGSRMLLGGSMIFNLNGSKKTITFPDQMIPNPTDPNAVNVIKEGIPYNLAKEEDVARYLNKELADAFGRGNVSVSYDAGSKKIVFQARPGASLSIHEGSGHLVGDDNVFKMTNGVSNRVGMDISLRKGGSSVIIKNLDEYAGTVAKEDGSGNYSSFSELLEGSSKLTFNINGNKIEVKTVKINTLGDLIKEINNTDNIVERGMTGSEYNSLFTVEYDSNRDSFLFRSKDRGANSQIVAGGNLWAGSAGNPSLETALFGVYDSAGYTAGRNALVFYKTGENAPVTTLESFDNSFTVNNAQFTIEGGFNVDQSGSTPQLIDVNTEGVSFKGKVNADKLVDSIKELIKDYNALAKLMGDQFKTMAERSRSTAKLKYEPLTDEQKEKMSEKEIEKWEAKAKEGLLFGDSNLRGARDELANVLYFNKHSVSQLSRIGIRQSPYSVDPNGSLEFDEAAFRKALLERPEEVKQIFLGDQSGNVGFSNHLKNVIANSASDTGVYKGALVESAGSKYAPGSIFTNSMFKQIDSLKKTIEFYEKRLKNDEDRYIKRFTNLEKIMKKAEMQSGYIMNLQGY